jgi:DNA-binding NtrC family response regulator
MCFERHRDKQADFEKVVAVSGAMRKAANQARQAAQVDSTVLLTGEPGTGRRFLASMIHSCSRRQKGPFVEFDATGSSGCAADPRLFGCVHKRSNGSSGAGRFQAAAGGTLFLGEVASLSLTCQARLLRALESRTISPVGSHDDVLVDVRVIAATTPDLHLEVDQGRFRRDLFYRLNVIPIHLPPLRERREDIPALASRLLEEICLSQQRQPIRPEPTFARTLASLDWPGNVRQLREFLEDVVALAEAPRLRGDDLPIEQIEQRAAVGMIVARRTLASIAKDAITSALEEHEGNRTQAARSLGISVRTLQRKLKRWAGMDP